jgi:hypothetical protein
VLSRQLVVETRDLEITAFFASLAALLMAAAAGVLIFALVRMLSGRSDR